MLTLFLTLVMQVGPANPANLDLTVRLVASSRCEVQRRVPARAASSHHKGENMNPIDCLIEGLAIENMVHRPPHSL